MPHNPRHGADPGVIIGGGSGSSAPPSPPKPNNPMGFFGSMYTSPGSSTQVTNQPPSVGFNEGQVDQGLMSGVMQAGGMSAQQANQIAQQAMGNTGQGFGITGTGNFGTQDTSGSGTDTSGSGIDTSGSGQGTDGSGNGDEGEGIDDIFFKIFTGEEIKQLSPERLKRAKSVLSQYISLGETNPLKLRALMTSNIAGGIFGKDQTVSDMEGNIVKPENAFNPDGTLKEGLRYTKEGIIKLLDEDQEGGNILESLKKFNPELYYPFMGMPATSGSLVDLAKIPVTPEMQGTNPELAKMIFDARMELDRMGKNPMTGESQGGGQGGISNISIPTSPGPTTGPVIPNQYGAFIGRPGPFIGNFVDTDGDGIDDRFQTGPGQPRQPFVNPKAPLPGTSGIAQAVGVPAALNYANIAPQFTGSPYTNQGVSPAFLENLRRFYG